MNVKETEVGRQRLYSGRILDLDKVTVTLPNGREAEREVVMHKGATAVIAVDENGRVPMVSQYRIAINEETLEIPAGKYDHVGEDPLECAVRELREETGLTAASMEKLCVIDTTPGFTSEKITLFLARGLSLGEASPDDDEFLECERIPLARAVEMVLQNEITDAKTQVAILKVAALQNQ